MDLVICLLAGGREGSDRTKPGQSDNHLRTLRSGGGRLFLR